MCPVDRRSSARTLRRRHRRQRSAGCIARGALSLECALGRGIGGRDRWRRFHMGSANGECGDDRDLPRVVRRRGRAGTRDMYRVLPASCGVDASGHAIAAPWRSAMVRLWSTPRAVLSSRTARGHPHLPLFRHQAHDDPFAHLGLQDISAWVDFTLLAKPRTPRASNSPALPPRRIFLAGTGIDPRNAAATQAPTRTRSRASPTRRGSCCCRGKWGALQVHGLAARVGYPAVRLRAQGLASHAMMGARVAPGSVR